MQPIYKTLHPVTALFADKDSSQRNVVRLYAQSQTEVVLTGTAGTGHEVLAELRSDNCPEVLVLDTLLQDMNLFDLLENIGRMQLKSHPAILVTAAKLTPLQQDRLLTAGADSFILKPYSLRLLFHAIADQSSDTRAFNERRIDRAVDRFLGELRADFSSKGVDYIRYAEQVLVPQGNAVSFNDIYQSIADRESINVEGVITAVRRTIKQMQERGTPEFLEMCAYCGKNPEKGLTNSDFLCLMAHRIRQELRG